MKRERLAMVGLEQGELNPVMWKGVEESDPLDPSGGVRSSWEAMVVGVCWSWEQTAMVEPTNHLLIAHADPLGWAAAEVPDSVWRVIVHWIRTMVEAIVSRKVHWRVRLGVPLAWGVGLWAWEAEAQPGVAEQVSQANRSLVSRILALRPSPGWE
jgi:hypothetical protein